MNAVVCLLLGRINPPSHGLQDGGGAGPKAAVQEGGANSRIGD